ncbi:Crp/Fnr family transcriptional regulator [Hymenobacter sp. CRA2]|uniref:Crp/Fnr family transcriptional regulator n=1 Tax=Hymenobacter sp. CRA2 TaxID=1955620 RepID=UPI00098F1852|nr:cyclic nucleotide-binding domain-containing protein [Hymenobacter sp. CRA2]OON69954.1 hypothetical protein B0919_04180 [Hymenobacter sp. CRA2]
MLNRLFEAGLLIGVPLDVAAGRYLFRGGQPAAYVYWLEQGCVEIGPAHAAAAASLTLGAPALLGASHLLKATCPHTARAHTDCRVRVLPRADLWELLPIRPDLRLYVLRCLCRDMALNQPHYE